MGSRSQVTELRRKRRLKTRVLSNKEYLQKLRTLHQTDKPEDAAIDVVVDCLAALVGVRAGHGNDGQIDRAIAAADNILAGKYKLAQ